MLYAVRLLCIIFTLTLSHVAFASPMLSEAKNAVILDYTTGDIIYNKGATEPVVPSSMTKLVTLYIVFDYLKKGVIQLDDTFLISKKAWKMGGSKTFVRVDTRVKVEDLIRGVVVQSGNDATIALAEGIASTEEAFVTLMHQTAQKLTLEQSQFKNATGWPEEGHTMSVLDIAKVSLAIIRDFPDYYHYFSETHFTFSNITQSNRNTLLGHDTRIDGLKTGHTEVGGYGIAISGKEGTKRLIIVVNGLNSKKERIHEAGRLFKQAMRLYENYTLVKAGTQVGTIPVNMGKKPEVPLIIKEDVTIIAPKLYKDNIKTDIAFHTNDIQAPILADTQVASLTIEIPEIGTKTYPLYTSESIEELGFFAKLYRKALLAF